MNESTSQPKLQLLRAPVHALTFQNANGWGIALVATPEGKTQKLTGVLPDNLEAGDVIEAIGNTVVDPKWGPQFESTAVVLHLPGSREQRAEWLAGIDELKPPERSRLLSLGPKLWDMLQDETINTLGSDLCGGAYIALNREYGKLAYIREAFLELLNAGYESRPVGKLVQMFGGDLAEQVRLNPYVPFLRVPVMCPFKLVDEIARRCFDVAVDDPRRIDAAVVGRLRNEMKYGHCYDILYTAAADTGRNIHVPTEVVLDALETQARSVVVRRNRVALTEVDGWEANTAAVVERLLAASSLPTISPDVELRSGKHVLEGAQRQAAELMLSAPIVVVTGGAGTGKTTIMQAALEHLRPHNVKLVAPTGKAARRISQVTGWEAETIHRALGATKGEGFKRHEGNPLQASTVICDEASMVSIDLASALLSALGAGSRIAFVGDAQQLAPVGPGQFFRDLIRSGVVPVVELDQVHRAAADTWVYKNGPRVLDGQSLDIEDQDDFLFYEIDDDSPDLIAPTVRKIIEEHLEKGPLQTIQVITPKHGNEGGTEELNATLQEALNPARRSERSWKVYSQHIRPRDVVVQLRNNYDIEVFNGEIGQVRSLDTKLASVHFADHAKPVTYRAAQGHDLGLAYALTCHRYQGSQVETAVVVCHSSQGRMLTRQWLYTALTRAQKKVILVGDRAGISQALGNDKVDARRTTLVERLRGEFKE